MKNIKDFLKGFGNYFVDFFMSVIVGLGIVIIANIPMKFMRVINMDLGGFIIHFLSMCIVLYIRSYRRGYHTNTRTYTFAPKKAVLFVGIVFAIQIALTILIGGHGVYISGPTFWLTTYILPAADRAAAENSAMIAGYDWLFMILADIFVYVPIMILGEYFGAKKNVTEVTMAQSDESCGKSMLKYPCLVLDHDDTVVQSEATVNYPFFVEFLKEYRPNMSITLHEYISGCYEPGYVSMCKERFAFTDEELLFEYNSWKEHIRSHIPAPYPGIERIIRRQKEEGGIICVVSQSSQENISRDYATHFGVQPDRIFGWDLSPEHRKPNPWALEQIMKTYNLSPAQLLVIDDMKAAVGMARAGGCPVAFAGWGRTEFPQIFEEMSTFCDFSFDSTETLYNFLFE